MSSSCNRVYLPSRDHCILIDILSSEVLVFFVPSLDRISMLSAIHKGAAKFSVLNIGSATLAILTLLQNSF